MPNQVAVGTRMPRRILRRRIGQDPERNQLLEAGAIASPVQAGSMGRAAQGVLTIAAVVAGALGSATAAVSPSTLDPDFGSRGQRLDTRFDIAFSEARDGSAALHGLRVLPNGRLVLFGTFRCGVACRREFVTRLTPAGDPDPGFGSPSSSGVVALPAVNESGGVDLRGLVVQRDGGILLGYRNPAAYSSRPVAPSVLHLGANGREVRSVPLPMIFSPQSLLPDGSVLGITGTELGLPGREVVRLRPNLSVDTAFGTGGAAPIPAAVRYVHGVATTSHAVLVGGSDGRGFVLARLSPAGTTIRVARLLVPGWAAPARGAVTQIAVRNDGSAVFVGRMRTRVGQAFSSGTVIGAFRADGRPDSRFGSRGLLRLPEEDSRVGVQRNRKLVVLASIPGRDQGARAVLVLRRFRADGRRDPTFPVRRIHSVATVFSGLEVGIDGRGRIIGAGGAFRGNSRNGLLLLRFRGGR